MKESSKIGRPVSVEKTEKGYPLVCCVCLQTRYVKNNRGPKARTEGVCLSCKMKGKPKKHTCILSENDILAYQEGESAASIAKRLCRSPNAIIGALKRQQVQTRSMSEAIGLLDNSLLLSAAESLRLSGEMGKMISAGRQGIALEDWQGYQRTYWDHVRSSNAWKEWRSAVFKRDNYHCIMCGQNSRRSKGSLHPHHIYPKAKFPDRVFEVDNGVTLCGDCHKKTFGKEELFIEQFRQVIAVDPRHTSQRCNQCGHTCRENRISQASFVCVACGHSENADINASRNILHRAGHALHGVNDSGVSHVVA